MQPEACAVPLASALDRRMVEAAFFRDAYRARLTNPDAGVIDIFFGVFGHHPRWMKRVLIARNRLAAAAGLATARDADILHPEHHPMYQVGDTIGPWPIYRLTADELIAGRDNRHLDFRLSVLREQVDGRATTVIATVCTTHNVLGKAYLCLVVPFHQWGVKWLISRALSAGRL